MTLLRLILFACVLLLPGQGWAAIAFDAASNASNTTISHTVGGGSDTVLYVCTHVYTNPTPTSLTGVTYNGVAMTHKSGPVVIAGQIELDLWELVAPASGTHDIVLSPTTNTAEHVAAASYTGVDQSTPSDTAATNNDDTGTSNGPITVDVSSAAGDVVIDCASMFFAAVVPTVGASQTSRAERDDTGATGAWVGISEEAGAGTVTMSWALNATPKYWGTIGVSLNPATSTSTRSLMMMGVGQ